MPRLESDPLEVMEPVADHSATKELSRSSGQDFLKWLALFFMVVDHLRCISPTFAWTVFPGRLALPFFCLSIALNVARLKPGDISFTACRSYILWMALFALISQPFYSFGTGESLYDLNIFFVLLPALLLALGLRARSSAGGLLVCAALLLTMVAQPLWGWGPIVVLLPAVMVFMLHAPTIQLKSLWMAVAGLVAAGANVGALVSAPEGGAGDPAIIGRAVGLAAISAVAPWIGIRVAERRWNSIPAVGMWAYGFYPAHLLVIGVLALLVGARS